MGSTAIIFFGRRGNDSVLMLIFIQEIKRRSRIVQKAGAMSRSVCIVSRGNGNSFSNILVSRSCSLRLRVSPQSVILSLGRSQLRTRLHGTNQTANRCGPKNNIEYVRNHLNG